MSAKKSMPMFGALVMLATSAVTSRAQASSGKYVVVPGGLAREDCIHAVPKGAEVDLANGNIIENGVVTAHYDDCPEPAIMRGSSAATAGLTVPNSSGWVEVASDHMDLKSGSNITGLVGNWTVPAIPSNNEGQTIYLWNGISDDSEEALLQPVLQFGPSEAGTPTSNGQDCWGIASWAIWPNGTVWFSPLENVSPGDLITGATTETQNGGTLSWTVKATDSTNGAWTQETFNTTGYQWSWAWGSVLEAWNVNTCADFPNGSDGFTQFTDTYVYNNGGQSTGWAGGICANNSSCQPACSSNCFDYYGPSCAFWVAFNNSDPTFTDMFY
jgi:hypothetical protein